MRLSPSPTPLLRVIGGCGSRRCSFSLWLTSRWIWDSIDDVTFSSGVHADFFVAFSASPLEGASPLLLLVVPWLLLVIGTTTFEGRESAEGFLRQKIIVVGLQSPPAVSVLFFFFWKDRRVWAKFNLHSIWNLEFVYSWNALCSLSDKIKFSRGIPLMTSFECITGLGISRVVESLRGPSMTPVQ